MLRACTLDFLGSWETFLPLVEFAYNNSYQSMIEMAPYEALYERKYRLPVHWDEAGEKKYLGPNLVEQASKAIPKIRQRMKTAQSRQKSYANKRRRSLEFEAGDKVFLKTSPVKGMMRFRQKGKLSPRYVGPFEILERVGKVAYRLALLTRDVRIAGRVPRVNAEKIHRRFRSHFEVPRSRDHAGSQARSST